MNRQEHEEEAIAHAMSAFKNHRATYKVQDGIDTLEFRDPDSICYSLRVVFDHERGNSVYICGDIGEAVIYPTCLATLKGMAECFTRRDESGNIHVNWGYFLEKVRAASDRYCWDSETFRHDFLEKCQEDRINGGEEFLEEYMGYLSTDIDIEERRGVKLSERAKRALEKLDDDYWEWIYDCGKRVSVRIILWLVAIRLAYEAVESEAANG